MINHFYLLGILVVPSLSDKRRHNLPNSFVRHRYDGGNKKINAINPCVRKGKNSRNHDNINPIDELRTHPAEYIEKIIVSDFPDGWKKDNYLYVKMQFNTQNFYIITTNSQNVMLNIIAYVKICY